MSSTRRAAATTFSPMPGVNSVISAVTAKDTVRPARLDRPLRQGSLDPGYSDPRLEEAIKEATDQARESARAQGYAAGWTQGRHAAAAQAQVQAGVASADLDRQRQLVSAQLQQLLVGLADSAAAMGQRSAAEWTEIADVLSEGALHLAQSLLARELQSVDDALMLNVRAVLQQLADPSQAVVHLHPQDAALLTEIPDGVRIVPDPAVPVGGVVALTPAQRLRLDLPEALANAQEVLRS